ncbi:MAG: DUF6178 family protein [Myxococcota bacterium]
MSSPSPGPKPVREILDLARRDRAAGTAALDALSPLERVDAVCGAPLARRAELLSLMSRPEEVIPLLPEAELCYVVRSIGLEDAPWLLAAATPEQLVACLDLDAWQGLEPVGESVEAWLAAMSAAGEKTLVAAARHLDPELLVWTLQQRAHIVMKPSGDEAEGWDPPEGAKTLEGQFYFAARRENDDLASLLAMLDALFRNDYWLYYRLMQGTLWELPSDLEEWALRWRNGRLMDLGFPSWDESMRIYGYVRPDRRADLSDSEPGAEESGAGWKLPVWSPGLPVPLDGTDTPYSIFRAASLLEDDARSRFFFGFVGLANRVAVADRMELGDAETLPTAIEKAAALASRGLDHVARARDLEPVEVLRRSTPGRLFQVGASLERDAGRTTALPAPAPDDATS